MELQDVAPALSVVLVSSLSIASQFLFFYIDPAPLTKDESTIFNALTAGLFICYFRVSTMDPGRIPRGWESLVASNDSQDDLRRRWCRKCDMAKPPRAHHCKSCQRCIPKMDHHCVWTRNCVSHRTLPHFIRFLSYSVSAGSYLEYLLFIRVSVLWNKRHLPSYLGPSAWQLALLFVLTILNTLSVASVGVLLLRTLYSVALNTTTIESWEIARHETLLRRSRFSSGYLEDHNGKPLRIVKQEFPYDIGIWANIVQAMGTANPLLWLFPFAGTAPVDDGTEWPENGFEDADKSWPPPDPDRVFRPPNAVEDTALELDATAVRRRQEEDQDRVRRRKKFWVQLEEKRRAEREEVYGELYEEKSGHEEESGGEEGWRNDDGERLADFGVDEDVEFYDEDDLPLAALMRKKMGG